MHVVIALSDQKELDRMALLMKGIAGSHQVLLAKNLRELQNIALRHPMHVLIMDVHIPKAIESMEKLKQESPWLKIVVYSPLQELSASLLDRLKPIITDIIYPEMGALWIKKFVEKVLKECAKEAQSYAISRIKIQNGSELYLFSPEDICFVEKVEREVVYHTAEQTFPTVATLEEVATKLPVEFYRSHRSYLINIQRVKAIHYNTLKTFIVEFTGTKKQALLSYSRKQELMQLRQ